MSRFTLNQTILLSLILLFSLSNLYAQSTSTEVCRVGLMKYSKANTEEQEVTIDKWLGNFQPVVGEEDRTTHSYRIPHTKLFAVASVFYTDESLQIEGHYDSMSLQLSVSPRPKHDPIHSLTTAEAEVIYTKSYAARVYLQSTISGRQIVLVMECRGEEKK